MGRRRKPPEGARPLHGWLVLDKPLGLSSAAAVARVRHILKPFRIGHGGTLDPLATGVLPIALGEATKTVSYAMDGVKTYRFTLQFGEARASDDAEGAVTATSPARPETRQIIDILPKFIGLIRQRPPVFSAIKVAGRRAYALARAGDAPELEERTIEINELTLVSRPDADHVELAVTCGKGTYVRAIARDMGRELGCYGHVTALRRTRVGPFGIEDAIPLQELEGEGANPAEALLSVEAGLTELPCVVVDRNAAARLRRGQSLLLRGRDAPFGGIAYAACGGVPVAFGPVEAGELNPSRVFNLPF